MKKKVLRVIAGATLMVAMAVGVQMNETEASSIASIKDMTIMAQAQSEGGGYCPNGCLMASGRCYCNGWWDHKDAGR